MRIRLGTRLYAAIKNNNGKKDFSVNELVGCDMPTLKRHLESKFSDGMTWDNYGSVWHVDHIVPCAVFDLSEAEQARECFHFTNLQPMFAEENMRKHARLHVCIHGKK